MDRLDPAPAELGGEELPVERLRELGGGRVRRVVPVDRAAHRRLGAAAELGRAARVTGVADPGRLRRRQRGQAGVAERVVRRAAGAVVLRSGGAGGEVPFGVRLGGRVGAGAVRPAVVAGPGDPVELDLPGRAAGRGGAGVRPVVAHVDDAGGLVDADPERVAEAHRVDLRAGPRGAGREEVAGRDRVRAVGVHLDPQDLAAQVVGVAGAALRVVPGVAVGALVDRRVAGRVERVGVVAGGQVEVAGGVEVDVTADVAAQPPVGRYVEHVDLAGLVEREVGVEREPGEPVDALPGGEVGAGGGRVPGRGGQRRRVVEVDVPVGGEAGVDADALQPLLVVGVDRQRADDRGGAGRVGAAQRAVAGGVQDRPVGQHRQGHRFAGLGDAAGEFDLLEVARRDGVGGRRDGRRGRCDGAGGGREQQRCCGGERSSGTGVVVAGHAVLSLPDARSQDRARVAPDAERGMLRLDEAGGAGRGGSPRRDS